MSLLHGQRRGGVEYLQHVGDLLLALVRVLAEGRSRVPGGEGDGAIRLCPAPGGQRLVKSATVHSAHILPVDAVREAALVVEEQFCPFILCGSHRDGEDGQ
eukprot:8262326-Pyramimonas_sp.AAC.1